MVFQQQARGNSYKSSSLLSILMTGRTAVSSSSFRRLEGKRKAVSANCSAHWNHVRRAWDSHYSVRATSMDEMFLNVVQRIMSGIRRDEESKNNVLGNLAAQNIAYFSFVFGQWKDAYGHHFVERDELEENHCPGKVSTWQGLLFYCSFQGSLI